MIRGVRRFASAAVLSALVAWCAPALAQDAIIDGPTEPSIDVQNFQPLPSPYGIFATEGSTSSGHLGFSAGVMVNYASEPLVLVFEESGDEVPIVEGQLVGDVLLALGLFDLAEIGVAVPVYLVNSVDGGTISPDAASGATVGDARLRGKVTLLDSAEHPVGIAPFVQVGFPTGSAEGFTSAGSFYGRPGVIVDTQAGPVLLAMNVSMNFQERRAFADIDIRNQLLFAAGAQVEVVPGTFLIGADVFGSTSFNDFFDNVHETPVEALGGIKLRTPIGLNLELAGGGGLSPGVGSPGWRVVGGVRYALYDADNDGDGIFNAQDECPNDAEDRDNFKDEDGCPELDNDEDGVLDTQDDCPAESEDFDGYEDGDGCPEEDNDRDGILDGLDNCPNEAGPKELGGCPDDDRDKDGVPNDRDPCPDDPEDLDGFQDDDGCPEPDNDNDGVLDKDDKCPAEQEDLDGFEDTDGCPELDNDKDGVLDKDDKCPLRAGSKRFEGCPGKQRVILVGDEIKILEKVFFDTGKASIQKKSYSLLDEVSETIRSTPSIKRLEVQGHTDDVGPDGANQKLSQERAESVRKYLIGKGIEEGRLVAKGFGEEVPAVPIEGLKGGALKKAREENRRVQFKILEQEMKTKVIEVAPDSE